MGINGGIFGGFTGGIFNNALNFSPGFLPGQSVPFNPNFNPSPIVNAFFGPSFPWAANSLITTQQIALAGGGTPLIASYPTFSPFTNQFLNAFNPATSSGLGGVIPNANGLLGNVNGQTGANDRTGINRNSRVNTRTTLGNMGGFGFNGFSSPAGFGGFSNMSGFGFNGFGSPAGLGGFSNMGGFGGFGNTGGFGLLL